MNNNGEEEIQKNLHCPTTFTRKCTQRITQKLGNFVIDIHTGWWCQVQPQDKVLRNSKKITHLKCAKERKIGNFVKPSFSAEMHLFRANQKVCAQCCIPRDNPNIFNQAENDDDYVWGKKYVVPGCCGKWCFWTLSR